MEFLTFVTGALVGAVAVIAAFEVGYFRWVERKNRQKGQSKYRLAIGKENGQSGFILIELLVVISILGVLAAVAVPQVAGLIGKSDIAAAQSERAIVQTAVDAAMAADRIDPSVTDGDPPAGVLVYIRGGAASLAYKYTITDLGDVTQGAKK